jgi:hypothetical protein
MTMLNASEQISLASVLPLTVDQYHQMIAGGILREGEPVELIDGVLIRKDRSASGEDPTTVGHGHAWVVYQLGELNELLKPHNCHIRTQQPVTLLPKNEPEPDGTILRGSSEIYRQRHPEPQDVLAVIEVADSSVNADRNTKGRIYSMAGIPVFVVVNLNDRAIEIYTKPDVSRGRYALTETVKAGQTLRLPTGTEFELEIAAERLLP